MLARTPVRELELGLELEDLVERQDLVELEHLVEAARPSSRTYGRRRPSSSSTRSTLKVRKHTSTGH